MDEDKLDEDLEKAIAQVAAEFSVLTEFKEDLVELRAAVENAKNADLPVKGIKKLFKDFRKLWRTEKKANHYINYAEDMLSEIKKKVKIKGKVDEIEKIIDHLEIAAKSLLRDYSRHAGRIKRYLNYLEKFLEDKDIEQAHQIVMDIQHFVGEGEKWIKSLSVSLIEARSLTDVVLSEIYWHPKDVDKKIKTLDSRERINYLIDLLSRRHSLPKRVVNYVLILLRREPYFLIVDKLKKADLFNEAAILLKENRDYVQAGEAFHRAGMFERAAKMYIKVAMKDKIIEAHEVKEIAKNFELANNWNSAAAYYLAGAFVGVKNYKLGGLALVKLSRLKVELEKLIEKKVFPMNRKYLEKAAKNFSKGRKKDYAKVIWMFLARHEIDKSSDPKERKKKQSFIVSLLRRAGLSEKRALSQYQEWSVAN
jgi:hypothetical protein